MSADVNALSLRLCLGASAILSIEEAAILLPIPPEKGREWITANVRQIRIMGVPSVRWSDVLSAADAGDREEKVAAEAAPAPQWLSTQEAAELLGVNRKTLDGLARGNLDVPGGPVVVGGSKRKHLRWPATGIDGWFSAVRARAATPEKTPQRTRPPRRPPVQEERPTDWAKVRKRLLNP